MHLYVRLPEGKQILVSVCTWETVHSLLRLLQQHHAVSDTDQLKFFCNGQCLDDGTLCGTLAENTVLQLARDIISFSVLLPNGEVLLNQTLPASSLCQVLEEKLFAEGHGKPVRLLLVNFCVNGHQSIVLDPTFYMYQYYIVPQSLIVVYV